MRDAAGGWGKITKAGALVCALLTACSSGGGGGDTAGGRDCTLSTVGVSIEPAAPTIVTNTTQPFVATVTGDPNTEVAWSVEEGAVGGTVSNTGVYTAPAIPGTYHLVAESQADACATAVVDVTVTPAPPITVTIRPDGPVTVEVQGSQTFLASVTGTTNTAVTWSVQPGGAGGTINSVTGVYTAPTTLTGTTVDVVVATSDVNPTASDLVEINILASTPIVISPAQVTVGLGGRVQFSLSELLGAGWSLNGDETLGSIHVGTGLYTAPFQMPSPTSAITVSHVSTTNQAAITLASRFLSPETLQVDGCVPQCPADQPNAIVADDLNGDGLDDVATANSGTGTVSVLIATDETHFAVPYRLQVGSPISGDPQALATADLNEDGTVQDPRADLVIADTDSSGLAVRTRLGQGDGTFGNERSTALPSTSNPLSVAVGHFDSSEHIDVAVANFATNSVDILAGVGDGTFSVVNTLTVGVSAPLSVAVADFNQDLFDDLAVANSGSDSVSVFLSNGDGTFVLQSVQLLASSVSAVAAVSVPGTLNGDNFPDLVATTTAPSGGLTVIFNSGPGPDPFVDPRFLAPGPPIATGPFPVAVATGDFNRDAVPDVVVANQGNSSVSTYLFDPSNDVLAAPETYAVGQAPQALAVGDFNGDGWPDIAVANSDDDTVSVLRNRGGPSAQ